MFMAHGEWWTARVHSPITHLLCLTFNASNDRLHLILHICLEEVQDQILKKTPSLYTTAFVAYSLVGKRC